MSLQRPSWKPAWYSRPASRLAFKRQLAATGLPVRAANPPLHLPGGFAVAVELRVPDLPEQTITIVFGPTARAVPRVFADGAKLSPHRYSDGSLCMWYPGDAAEQRWTRRDGGAVLIGHIVAHLLREEWWRCTGEWPGAEAEHIQQNASTGVDTREVE